MSPYYDNHESEELGQNPTALHATHPELNQLVCAALVSLEFCNLLLANPARAIAVGYSGTKFKLNAVEREWVFAICAASLQEFAAQLEQMMDTGSLIPALHELAIMTEFELNTRSQILREA